MVPISSVTTCVDVRAIQGRRVCWVTFVRVILPACSRISDSLFWREKGKESPGVLRREVAVPWAPLRPLQGPLQGLSRGEALEGGSRKSWDRKEFEASAA